MNVCKYTQLLLAYFIVIGAIAGVAMMLCDPTGVQFGMDLLMQKLQIAFPFAKGLFENLYASAIALLCVVGVPNIVAIILIHKRSKLAIISSLICGVILSFWILVELYAWGPNAMSLLFGVVAVMQITVAIIWHKKMR